MNFSTRAARLIRAAAALPALSLSMSQGLFAQATSPNDIPEFTKIRTPVSPAFIILGITPTSIERPTSPSAVATSALTSFTGDNRFTIPKSFALDVAPYWLISHPTLTYGEYTERNTLGSVLRNTTVSLGTTDSTFKTTGANPQDTSIKKIGFGVRTIFFSTIQSDTNCFSPLRRSLTAIASLKVRAMAQVPWPERETFLRLARSVRSIREANGDQTTAAFKAMTDSIDQIEKDHAAAMKKASERVSELLSESNTADKAAVYSIGATVAKSDYAAANKACVAEGAQQLGFLLSGAAASAVRFPGDSFDAGRMSAFGAWLTPAFYTTSNSLIGVARLAKQDNASKTLGRTVKDLGVRDVAAWGRYALSGEAVSRWVTDTSASERLYRVNVGFDIKVGEKWLNLSFGKDFAAKDKKSLLMVANFQWNIGDDRDIKPMTEADLKPASKKP